MRVSVVIGGGRWGRVIAGKLSGLGYQVHVATDFRVSTTDIARSDIARLQPPPEFIYVASRSEDHEKDFDLIAPLGVPVWIEKNFSGMSEALLDRFSRGENFLFSQQLFNTSMDRYAADIKQLKDFQIETEVEQRIVTDIGLFDWLCHDLSLIARALWLRGETGPLTIKSTAEFANGICVADFVINGIPFRIVLKESTRRSRTVRLTDDAKLVSGHDGVLRYRASEESTSGADTSGASEVDLLGAALKVALETYRGDVHALTRILLQLHSATFPLVRRLNYKRI